MARVVFVPVSRILRHIASSPQGGIPYASNIRSPFDFQSFGLGGAVGAVLLGRTRPSYAAPMQFKATLNGASEVPPNTTTGTASVTASFDPATKMLTWNGAVSGLTGGPAAAHFHGPAEPGKNAGVEVWISTKGSPFQARSRISDPDRRTSLRPPGRPFVREHPSRGEPGRRASTARS